ncbi:MAG TPA: vanadium-dependent haloperoxidase [Vicinamibacterales bacterium]|nr:vanadium-dependent haloperoxidase [Vicinamibacterales bacterium]
MQPLEIRISRWKTTIALASFAGALLAPQDATADGAVAKQWVGQAFSAVRTGSPGIHTGTPGAARTYAMVTAAMYDAVNGIDRALGTSNLEQCLVSAEDAPAGGNREHAAAAAAHAVLVALFAANATVVSNVNSALAADCPLPITDASEAGCRWGNAVGRAIVIARSTDGTQVATSQAGAAGVGKFPRTFSGTQFKNMTPFGVASVAPYLSSGSPDLSSEEYAESFNEVKEIGSALDTDSERRAITRHWQAEANTVRETGLWLKAALNVVDAQGTVNSLSDTVRLFALLGMAVADSITASWADKHGFQYWRPGDAIRQADMDGNDATAPDLSWNPRGGAACAVGAPVSACSGFGGTPEHTSGTSTFAGAASTVLAAFYCRDDVAFTFAGEQAGSLPRSYTGFKEAAREAGRSRVYGGIHFQFSIEKGYEAGKDIAREILRGRLVPEGQACTGATCVCVPN